MQTRMNQEARDYLNFLQEAHDVIVEHLWEPGLEIQSRMSHLDKRNQYRKVIQTMGSLHQFMVGYTARGLVRIEFLD